MKTKVIAFLKSSWLKVRKYVIYCGLILGLLLIAYIAGRCSTREERQNQTSNLIAARDSVSHFIVTIDGLKNSIWEKNAIILGQEQAIAAGIIERDLLKKLHIKDLIANTELSGTIHRQDSLLKLPPNTVFITIKDTSGVTRDYVRLPFDLLKIADKYLLLNAGMTAQKKAWYKVTVPFDGTVTIGYKKTGLLKTTPVGIFTSGNSYLQVNKMDVLINKESEKWFQKWYVHAGAGGVFFELLRIIFSK